MTADDAIEKLRKELSDIIVAGSRDHREFAAEVTRSCFKIFDAYDNAIFRKDAALRLFLEDDRFQVAVGGNPLAVEKMLAQARDALGEK